MHGHRYSRYSRLCRLKEIATPQRKPNIINFTNISGHEVRRPLVIVLVLGNFDFSDEPAFTDQFCVSLFNHLIRLRKLALHCVGLR